MVALTLHDESFRDAERARVCSLRQIYLMNRLTGVGKLRLPGTHTDFFKLLALLTFLAPHLSDLLAVALVTMATNSVRSIGAIEHAQTLIIDENLSYHHNNKAKTTSLLETTPLRRSQHSIPELLEYGGCNRDTPSINTIRFQVVVWSVGKVDVVESAVPVTFRLTIFWNDQGNDDDMNDTGTVSSRAQLTWSMQGRQHAVQREPKEVPLKTIEVPPVSILNTSTFSTIGSPEVAMLREDTRLMRWTCMYRATLIQDSFTVEDFPHDQHDITLKLAILAHRGRGREWDRSVWKLALANNNDSQGSTRVPYGLIVDQVKIPGFLFNKEKGLDVDILPLDHGPAGDVHGREEYLQVKFSVLRDSGYYDKNILPLLAFLNLVAVSILCLPPADFFQRGLLTLQITFVEIGIRMTTDSHLPSVAYQIKMQRLLNEYFYGLLLLVLEAMLVYELYEDFGVETTNIIDWVAAIVCLCHNGYSLVTYYGEARRAKRE
jgi:hypothetical protein